MRVRRELFATDRGAIASLLAATGFFNPEEMAVALELVEERLSRGPESHYRFLVAEEAGKVLGYACWGPIPGTRFSADLYWIAVDPAHQGKGVGKALLAAAEAWMLQENRHRVYVETSTRPQYTPTRGFYLACGYHLVAELPDFYAPGDGQVIFLKVLSETRSSRPSA
ncbi:MAG: GNAT family N-acetyltransferase [Thermoanaerobaculum sp.]